MSKHHRSSHFSDGITRCRPSTRQQINRAFSMLFQAAFLFGVSFALFTYVVVKCVAPEWLIALEQHETLAPKSAQTAAPPEVGEKTGPLNGAAESFRKEGN